MNSIPKYSEVSKRLSYNKETGELTWLTHKRFAKGTSAGSSHPSGYLHVNLNYRTFIAHRVCWLLATGAWPDGEVDHINKDPLDNRWVNLRVVSTQVNSKNRPMRSDNKSGHTGVGKCKKARPHHTQKWYAQIGRRQIGKYNSLAEAITAREEALQNDTDYTDTHGVGESKNKGRTR